MLKTLNSKIDKKFSKFTINAFKTNVIVASLICKMNSCKCHSWEIDENYKDDIKKFWNAFAA